MIRLRTFLSAVSLFAAAAYALIPAAMAQDAATSQSKKKSAPKKKSVAAKKKSGGAAQAAINPTEPTLKTTRPGTASCTKDGMGGMAFD